MLVQFFEKVPTKLHVRVEIFEAIMDQIPRVGENVEFPSGKNKKIISVTYVFNQTASPLMRAVLYVR